jgi:urea transport system permease protein
MTDAVKAIPSPTKWERARVRAFVPEISVFLLLVVALPLLHSAGLISDFRLNLFGKYLALALLALGMDLIWGYTGILSLGQAVFFGFGAYSIGMHMLLASSGKSVYGEAIPDFMVWNQVKELPAFWVPFRSFAFAVVAVLALPALVAALIGWLTLARRVAGVYFSILTQAIAFAAWLMLNRNEMKLGGTNGLTDFKTLLGFSLGEPATQKGLYVVTALAVSLAFILGRILMRSKTGLVLTAVRDQEARLQFLGYPVSRYKVFIFAVAAMLAGLGGALYAPQVGIVTPNQMGVGPSLEVVICVAFGGRGTLLGPLIGSVAVSAARSYLTQNHEFHLWTSVLTYKAEWWPIVLGGMFIVVVLALPEGIVGLPARIRHALRARRERRDEAALSAAAEAAR